jgi:hypothetical protein
MHNQLLTFWSYGWLISKVESLLETKPYCHEQKHLTNQPRQKPVDHVHQCFKQSFPCADVAIDHFAGDCCAMVIGDGATATIVRCNFTTNWIKEVDDENPMSAVITIRSISHTIVPEQHGDTIVRMEQLFFSENKVATHILVHENNLESSAQTVFVYSDSDLFVTNITGPATKSGFPKSLSDAPADRPGLTADSPWLKNVQVGSCSPY